MCGHGLDPWDQLDSPLANNFIVVCAVLTLLLLAMYTAEDTGVQISKATYSYTNLSSIVVSIIVFEVRTVITAIPPGPADS